MAANPGFPHVPWSRHASIYEVNLRQHTPEGTLAAVRVHGVAAPPTGHRHCADATPREVRVVS